MSSIVESSAPAASRWSVTGWIVLAALVSFAFSGFIQVSSNNIYHLPILFGAYDLPQFQDDAFIQSLRNFSSGFWIAFSDSARFVDPKLFLGIWVVITHFLFLGACVHLASSLGYDDRGLLSAFAMLLAVASLSMGEAAGGAGLMLESFTHSELANAAMLMTFSFSLSRRYGLAVFFGCVTFFLNAFMAVWASAPVLALAAYHVWSREMSFAGLVRKALPGLAGLVLVLPVLGSILGNHEGLSTTTFSYSDYLRSFYPAHFFIASVGSVQLLEGAALVAALALTVRTHGRTMPAFLALVFGAVAVLLIGIVVPLVTDSRTVLNLHLIRSFVMLHMLAEFSVALFALARVWTPEERNDRAIGLIVIGLLFLPRPLWMAIIPVVLFDRLGGRGWAIEKRHRQYLTAAGVILLAACVVALPVRAYRKFQYTRVAAHNLGQWEQLGTWAQLNTVPSAKFLISPGEGSDAALGFSYSAARQIWIDYKYGAAVMWTPSYYPIWKARREAVAGLLDVDGMRAYARKEGIDYLASSCIPDLPEIYRYGTLCIYEGAETTR